MIRRQAILHQNHRAAGPARVRFGVSAILIASAMLACQPALTRADGSGDSLWSWADGAAGNRQFYLGGIVGADFATLDKFPDAPATVPNQSIFTAGGTAGVRFLRESGGLRLEFEGRGRDQVVETTVADFGSLTMRATDGWSAMVNIWRDFTIFEKLGVYGGGGIGSGGYRSTISGTGLGSLVSANDPVTNFAWQAGGGVFYEISPRATIDLGYRFFSISESTAGGEFLTIPFDYPTNFAASELLLQVRIYEPFRRWRQ